MLRKLMSVALLAALIGLPAQAAPTHCYRNFVTNGAFVDSTAWTYESGAYRETSQDDPCDLFFGYRMTAAALTVPYAKVWQQFTTIPSTAIGWSLSFEVQTQSLAGATGWDELRVLVQDLSTGQSEVFFVKGSQLTSTCQRFDFTPRNNYSGHVVRVTFSAQPFTALDMYVDNVTFFGRYC
jgi:hypothetical protein